MDLPARVLVTDVGPRDGLQSEPAFIPTERKVALVNALSAAGVGRIEVTSFVSPRAVPQMADAEAVMAGITRAPGVRYSALVPNARGAERALAARADELNVVTSSTETMNQRNLRMSIADSIVACREIVRLAEPARVPVAGVVSTSFGCPYEGPVTVAQVIAVVERLVDAGVSEVSLADTIGVGNPRQVEALVAAVRARWPALVLGLHFHDTRGLGLANVLAGLQAGVARYDASVAGVGACPFAPGATGNICTEDLVYLLDELGVATGVDLAALIAAARLMRDAVGHDVPSHMLRAGPRPQLPAAS
ncbi:MAG TPA: hydroxymethylglutaryl-CoA lyase [Chloroflexota bacterium]|nr:hydroxymethylglutaryl-CoA lyase [Chloroflexota bacterium]